MQRVGIGIIGCGNISEAYLKAAATFPILDVRGVADLRPEAAQARAGRVRRQGDDASKQLLADPSIEIVVNLTVPAAHVEVGLQRHRSRQARAFGEAARGADRGSAHAAGSRAAARGLRVGCAPDTFLGGAHQTCRKLVDEGAIGRPVAGTAFFMCPGHESWHPNPAFYYAPGGGPMLDMGPYYITDLVNLLGPVEQVAGMTARAREQAHDHQRAARRADDDSRGRHSRGRHDALRFRRCGHDRDELRRAAAPACADRAVRQRVDAAGARPESIRRRRSRSGATRAGRSGRASISTPTATTASSAWPIWRMRSASAGRIARRESSPTTCSK